MRLICCRSAAAALRSSRPSPSPRCSCQPTRSTRQSVVPARLPSASSGVRQSGRARIRTQAKTVDNHEVAVAEDGSEAAEDAVALVYIDKGMGEEAADALVRYLEELAEEMTQPLVTWPLSSLGCLHEAAKAARSGGGTASTHSTEAVDDNNSGSTSGAVVLLLDLPPFLAQHATEELEYGMQEGYIPYAMVSSVWSGQEPWEGWVTAETAEVEQVVRHAHARRFALDVPMHTAPTEWNPADATVTLNLQLDGALVRSGGGAPERWDVSGCVVLDDFVDDADRAALRNLITEAAWAADAEGPPESKWERELIDLDGLPASWGLSSPALDALVSSTAPAVVEAQSRLAALYPDYIITRMPPAVLDGCAPMVANAAVYGDAFQWHIDMDPALAPPSPWTALHGTHPNREPGKPFFVTMLLYVDEAWQLEWDAETMILDSGSNTGVFVRPAPGRMLLLDQDVTHRLSTPSMLAKRPRYSLVWKLVFHPRDQTTVSTICRPEWGAPTRFGSAASAPPQQ